MKLLIVDDHAATRRLIGKVVHDLFSVVAECDEGADALAAYEQLQPDWVLMDIEMNRMDGLTATRNIVHAFPDAKIVIVSKHSGEPFREAAREAGACGYVLKENLMAIREVLERL
jgi:two-component system response regulator DegU